MAFQGIDYRNTDLRKLAEDLINNGLQDPTGQPLGTLMLQLLDYTDTLTTFTGLIRDNTQPVANAQMSAERIIATGSLDDLYSDYTAWLAANPSAVIISIIPINLSSERGILITYYE